MRVVLRAAAFAAALISGGCATINEDAAKLPADDAPDATVVLQVPPGFAGTWYELRAVMYDSSTHNVNTAHPGWGSPRYLAGRRFGGHFLLTHNENDPKKYIVQSVKPGPYVFGTFAVKYQWAGCFHKDTLSFEIKPGEVLFLGQFDPVLPSAEVLREAAKAGQFKAYAGSSRFEYMDNISAPRLKQPDERSLAEVRKYAAAELPQIRGAIQPVSYARANFNRFTGTQCIGGAW